MDTQVPIGSLSGPASSKVFGTYELLESLLLQLSSKDLLLAQAVCRQWRNVIKDSHRIQVALCFRGHPGQEQPRQLFSGALSTSFCPVLLTDAPSALSFFHECVHGEELLLNPLFRMLFTLSGEWRGHRRPTDNASYTNWKVGPGNADLTLSLCSSRIQSHDNYNSLAPSWKSMFLTQPPVTRVRLPAPWRWFWRGEGGARPTFLENESGVRIGDFVRWTEEELCTRQRDEEEWKKSVMDTVPYGRDLTLWVWRGYAYG